MSLGFDFRRVETVEFGVGLESDGEQTFHLVPVDKGVQRALGEMAEATWAAMEERTDNRRKYEPSEKYESIEYVYVPLNDDLARAMRDLHEALNLPMNAGALTAPDEMFSYFARMTDSQHRHLTAVRRATQFKGVLRTRLIRFVTDSLKIVEDKVFKLDTDFD